MGGPRSVPLKRNETREASGNGQEGSPITDKAEKIRELAYQKWSAAGCPASDGVEFWLAAEAELTNQNRPTKPK